MSPIVTVARRVSRQRVRRPARARLMSVKKAKWRKGPH
jgi:hypothetical protein